MASRVVFPNPLADGGSMAVFRFGTWIEHTTPFRGFSDIRPAAFRKPYWAPWDGVLENLI